MHNEKGYSALLELAHICKLKGEREREREREKERRSVKLVNCVSSVKVGQV